MRHILVGGNGFVGRAIVDRIVADQEDEAVVVDLPQSLAARPVLCHPAISDYSADISVPGSLDSLAVGPDDVIHHLATMLISPNKPRFGRDEYFRKCAVHGTRELIAWLKKNGGRKLVFWSTDMVYGPVLEVPRTENHPMKPFGPYGRSKVAAENIEVAKLLKSSPYYQGMIAAVARFDDEVEALKEAGVDSAFNIYGEAGAGFAGHICVALDGACSINRE